MSTVLRKLSALACFTLAVSLAAAGCSNPLEDNPAGTPETASEQATATSAPPITIVTPTPVDATAIAANPPEAQANEERPATYIVAENDTLYGIAARFNVEISRLVEENGLSDPNDIQVGQELIIPPVE